MKIVPLLCGIGKSHHNSVSFFIFEKVSNKQYTVTVFINTFILKGNQTLEEDLSDRLESFSVI